LRRSFPTRPSSELCPVEDGVLAVSGGDASPLLDAAVLAFDHVAVAVVGGVESDGPAASGSAALAVSLLVVGFGDHGLDTAVAKVSADRAGRVRLIAADRVRSGPRPADVTPHLQLCHQRQEDG